jgi:hypothetical protein
MYRQKKYVIVLEQGNYFFIRRLNTTDARWVHKDLIMELNSGNE